MLYRGVAFELMIDLYEWITDRRIVFPAPPVFECTTYGVQYREPETYCRASALSSGVHDRKDRRNWLVSSRRAEGYMESTTVDIGH